ncbi:class II fructose-bisphosphate aldolase [Maritalea sp.]|uniref:class II fructose-bisphosphate aldolase n=1 Tax=Maritalea sp. TaxID=2003361 RepID=UPI0039E6FC66
MSAVSLADVLRPAMNGGYAIAGLVCLGWEDARAYVEAAEETGIPIILQAGPGCRNHTPVPILGKMFRHLADQASVPVVCHIDHGYTLAECVEGIESGFTSVMFDGSKLPISENIDKTAAIVELAHAAGVSVEGEVGFVGYADGAASAGTDPQEAARFDKESGADALAISVGNVHLKTEKTAGLNFELLREIEAVTNLPLVLHGGSGIPVDVRQELAQTSRVSKFNIGTELRMAFGQALRKSLNDQPDIFDRVALLGPTIAPVREATKTVITAFGRV